MKIPITATILLASVVSTAAAQNRTVVQVIRVPDTQLPTFHQFDETGAVRFCRMGRDTKTSAAVFLCTEWMEPSLLELPAPASPSE